MSPPCSNVSAIFELAEVCRTAHRAGGTRASATCGFWAWILLTSAHGCHVTWTRQSHRAQLSQEWRNSAHREMCARMRKLGFWRGSPTVDRVAQAVGAATSCGQAVGATFQAEKLSVVPFTPNHLVATSHPRNERVSTKFILLIQKTRCK